MVEYIDVKKEEVKEDKVIISKKNYWKTLIINFLDGLFIGIILTTIVLRYIIMLQM